MQLVDLALADAVGFRFNWDNSLQQWAHASGIMILTPEGRLSRYFYGIKYSPLDVRLGLTEASANKIGSPVDQFLLRCYHYDPVSGRYTPAIMELVQISFIATVLAIGAGVFLLARRGRRLQLGS